MKNFRIVALFLSTSLVITSCSNDDAAVNEEELITTVTAVYTPQGGGTAITLQSKDLDGDGPNEPVVSVDGAFAQNKTYDGVVTFKNETTTPVDDITAEIVEEGTDHQIFYEKTGSLNAFSYATNANNMDANGNPVGIQTVFSTTTAATGTLTITLKHLPNKSAAGVANGDITNAGGNTDATVTFNVSVQ